MEHEVEICIGASVDKAWEILADLRRWPEWTSSMRSLQVLSSGPVGVGARVRVKQPLLPANLWTITEWRPGRSFSWETRSLGLFTTASHVLEPHGEGCKVVLHLRMTGFLSGLVRVIGGSLTRRYMRLEAEGLKARGEAPSGSYQAMRV